MESMCHATSCHVKPCHPPHHQSMQHPKKQSHWSIKASHGSKEQIWTKQWVAPAWSSHWLVDQLPEQSRGPTGQGVGSADPPLTCGDQAQLVGTHSRRCWDGFKPNLVGRPTSPLWLENLHSSSMTHGTSFKMKGVAQGPIWGSTDLPSLAQTPPPTLHVSIEHVLNQIRPSNGGLIQGGRMVITRIDDVAVE